MMILTEVGGLARVSLGDVALLNRCTSNEASGSSEDGEDSGVGNHVDWYLLVLKVVEAKACSFI
jgi:hypothetical protein